MDVDMDMVMCPNGHANRVGTTQCIVCRAPILVEPIKSLSEKDSDGEFDAAAVDSDLQSDDGRSAIWPILGILLLIGLGIGLLALFRSNGAEPPTTAAVVPPTATKETAAVVVEPTTVPDEPPVAATEVTAATETAEPPPTTSLTDTPVPATVTAKPEATPAELPTESPEAEDPDNLLGNGAFTSRWIDDWRREGSSSNGVQVVEIIQLEDGPAEQALHLQKTGAGVMRIGQVISVPGRATELDFTGQISLTGSGDDPSGNEGRAALVLIYGDENGQALGASAWMDGSTDRSSLWGKSPLPPFGPSLAPHFVETEEWTELHVDLQQEFLSRLPLLNADAVKQVMVMLLTISDDDCGPEACTASISAADLRLVEARDFD